MKAAGNASRQEDGGSKNGVLRVSKSFLVVISNMIKILNLKHKIFHGSKTFVLVLS